MRFFILSCVLIYSVSRYHDLSSLYLRGGCDTICYFAYPFIHASFLHLLLNMFVITSFYERFSRTEKTASFISSIMTFPLATMVGISDKPTVGASGIAFCMVGTYLSSLIYKFGITTFIKYLALTSILMAIQAIVSKGSINWPIHYVSLITSTVLSYLYMEWRNVRS